MFKHNQVETKCPPNIGFLLNASFQWCIELLDKRASKQSEMGPLASSQGPAPSQEGADSVAALYVYNLEQLAGQLWMTV